MQMISAPESDVGPGAPPQPSAFAGRWESRFSVAVHGGTCMRPPIILETRPWAYSSVVEHCVDIAGVASSILATPTISPFDIIHFIACPAFQDGQCFMLCRARNTILSQRAFEHGNYHEA